MIWYLIDHHDDGGILVFLPGIYEIGKLCDMIKNEMRERKVNDCWMFGCWIWDVMWYVICRMIWCKSMHTYVYVCVCVCVYGCSWMIVKFGLSHYMVHLIHNNNNVYLASKRFNIVMSWLQHVMLMLTSPSSIRSQGIDARICTWMDMHEYDVYVVNLM